VHVDAVLLVVIALMLATAKLCGDLFERIGMPPVLGELAAGIVIGNLHLSGWHGLDFIASEPNLALLAELGVVLLLFQVGLESNLVQMARVGGAAFAVASIGVVVPMALGYALHALIAPDRSWHAHLFIGAVLSATSVGITARVFKDLGKIDSPTGRVVLGAAVIDDVLGLVVLAVVAGVVKGADSGVSLDVVGISILVAKAIGFLGAAILLGPIVSRHLYRAAGVLRVKHMLLAASLIFCFVIAYFANLVGLAPIVGAFAAGLVLDELVYRDLATREDRPLETQLAPLAELLTPLFFVITGAQVDLASFADVDALALALALTAAAVIGKQACALVAYGDGVHRLSVGLGMIPRGEVGLIFAATGSQLVLGGAPVVPPSTYAAIVLMVLFTSMVTPPLLAWSLRRDVMTPRVAFNDDLRSRKQPVYVVPATSEAEAGTQ
jgi:Kef-type K+ transport system membrane component KefB